MIIYTNFVGKKLIVIEHDSKKLDSEKLSFKTIVVHFNIGSWILILKG